MNGLLSRPLREIFDVMFGNEPLPENELDWLYQNLRTQKWRLTVIPFPSLDCPVVKVDEKGNNYACGYWQDNTSIGFNYSYIRGGDHFNLHKVIHSLCNVGVSLDEIKLEQRFRGFRVDVLAKMNEKYIVVELGSLSSSYKFGFVDDELVKAFWFGDKDKFIYSLSRRS